MCEDRLIIVMYGVIMSSDILVFINKYKLYIKTNLSRKHKLLATRLHTLFYMYLPFVMAL